MANFVWINGHFGVNDYKKGHSETFAWKNRDVSSICLENQNFSFEKLKLFGNVPGKIGLFWTRIHDTQIWKQI